MPNLPAFAVRLLSANADTRQVALDATHPDYAEHAESWGIQLDAFEGRGGFLSGEYLWPYPSEEKTDYEKRQKMARYHNYVETLVDLYVRFMFTQGVERSSKNEDFNVWIENVDGAGCDMDAFMKHAASVSLVNGHAGVLVDKTSDTPTGPAKADEHGVIFAKTFTATAILDWRFDLLGLSAIKLQECVAQPPIDEELPSGDDAIQILLWDREGWVRLTGKGDLVTGDVTGLGLVPVVIVRPKPSHLSMMLGRALVGNINVIRALFNRASEEDEVLRTQAFSLLTVNVAADSSVAQAREAIGSQIGTSKALVVSGEVDYKTPDMNVPGAIRANIDYLVQEVYRAAHMRFKRDSLASETAEAIRLQHSELNEMLQGFAKALSQAEKAIGRAWFAWSFPTAEAAQSAYDAAQVEATYPTEFFLDELMTDLEAWAEGLRMGLGDTLGRRIKKKAARRLDPEMPPDVQEKVDTEIDNLPVEPPSPFGLDTGPNANPDLVPAGAVN